MNLKKGKENVMKYKSLKGLYYQDTNNFDDVYQQRINNIVSVKTKLFIHPFDTRRQIREKNKYEIFYLPYDELEILIQEIFDNTKKIERIRLKLPSVAEQQLFSTNLVNELQSTNEIEGIRSTRKEINEVMSKIKRKDYSSQRFEGLVKQYLNLRSGNHLKLTEVSDFRKIWDSLLSRAEVEDVPDGKLFRKDSVFITDGNKNVHEGDYNEKDIISDLQSLIDELNNEEIPMIPRFLIAHYFYEYVHPFYDGNGRTGRYILCSYLSQVLDPLSAITFSSTIAKNKSSYYKAFMEMSDPHNRADATLLIVRMLKILKRGQIDLLDAMKQDTALLNQASEIVTSLDLTEIEAKIIYSYFQQYIFGTVLNRISDNELRRGLNLSRYLFNQTINKLAEKNLVEEIKKSPKTHTLSKQLMNKLDI
jgi:Fic family protein